MKIMQVVSSNKLYYTPLNEVEGGYIGFTLSVSALYLLQYLQDPFHIHTYYQASSEGVLCVKIFFQN